MIELSKYVNERRMARNESGFVLALLGIALVVIVLCVGFAVDLGSWYLQAARLQRAADGAALTAASSLPDKDSAINAANATYLRNGYTNGAGNIVITNTVTANGQFSTSIQNKKIPTYFVKIIMPSISVKRSSLSERVSSTPSMGSPFNVLGTGDLDLGPKMEKQNFWLAINLPCSPKEDGDYFSALRDQNKGPFDTSHFQSDGATYPAPNGRHDCKSTGSNSAPKNPDYNGAGYSYYIDVPPPKVAGSTVDVKIYDPEAQVDPSKNTNHYPDAPISVPKDDNYGGGFTMYEVFDMGADLNSTADDVSLMGHPYAVDIFDPRVTPRTWWDLTTIPYSKIKNGGHFRVQIFNKNNSENWSRGINSFSVGAFASWEPKMQACDSRTDELCPKVYAKNAMSVYNNLGGTKNGTAQFYFAEIDPNFVGQTFNMMLWDPGEGVKKIELLGPDGTPLSFSWSTDTGGLSGSGNSIDTSGNVAQPGKALSNAYKFNDRLLTLKVTIPPDYPAMVTAANSDFLRLRYTVGDAPNDRTTWGISLVGGVAQSPHLVRPQ